MKPSCLEALRDALINTADKSVKLASLGDSVQSQDISNDILLDGYCRIHTFSEEKKEDWIADPLPTIPAAKALGCRPDQVRNARVLQLSGCNIRCWYCFVDDSNLSPKSPKSRFFAISEIIDTLMLQSQNPFVLDLSGGNSALLPEWTLWTVQYVKDKNYKNIYIWTDDNLDSVYTRY